VEEIRNSVCQSSNHPSSHDPPNPRRMRLPSYPPRASAPVRYLFLPLKAPNYKPRTPNSLPLAPLCHPDRRPAPFAGRSGGTLATNKDTTPLDRTRARWPPFLFTLFRTLRSARFPSSSFLSSPSPLFRIFPGVHPGALPWAPRGEPFLAPGVGASAPTKVLGKQPGFSP